MLILIKNVDGSNFLNADHQVADQVLGEKVTSFPD
jgi:hypothetical protein